MSVEIRNYIDWFVGRAFAFNAMTPELLEDCHTYVTPIVKEKFPGNYRIDYAMDVQHYKVHAMFKFDTAADKIWFELKYG